MEQDSVMNSLMATIEGADDATLAEYASDSGIVGEYAREELKARGHQVSYSDVNGVQSANVVLKGEAPVEDRSDSVNPVELDDNPHQTTEQQNESAPDGMGHPSIQEDRPLDPTTVAGRVTSGQPVNGEAEDAEGFNEPVEGH